MSIDAYASTDPTFAFERPDWQQDAACRGMGPALFFPARGETHRHSNHAVRVCQGCPVRTECATFAIEGGETSGVWGGLSGRARRGLHVAGLNIEDVA